LALILGLTVEAFARTNRNAWLPAHHASTEKTTIGSESTEFPFDTVSARFAPLDFADPYRRIIMAFGFSVSALLRVRCGSSPPKRFA
jgi:hypothetical protein